jgi:hypothetical protein
MHLGPVQFSNMNAVNNTVCVRVERVTYCLCLSYMQFNSRFTSVSNIWTTDDVCYIRRIQSVLSMLKQGQSCYQFACCVVIAPVHVLFGSARIGEYFSPL